MRFTTLINTTIGAFCLATACAVFDAESGETVSFGDPDVVPPESSPTPVASVAPNAALPATGPAGTGSAPAVPTVDVSSTASSSTPSAGSPAVTPTAGGTPSASDGTASSTGTVSGAGNSDTGTGADGGAGQPPECVPEPATTQACTDDINEDQPDLPCSQWVEWGTCDEAWMLERHVCDRSCGRCDGDIIIPAPVNTCVEGATSSEPASSTDMPVVPGNEGPTLPPLEGGEAGFTTRYWDCCKPHCGWPGNSSRPISSCSQNNSSLGGDYNAASACEGGPAHMCWNFGPQSNGDNIAYAFAAHNGVGCGTCFQLEFTGESKNPKPDTGHDLGSQSLKGKQMIVQVINTGGIEQGQFDLLVPGGGVGDFDACSNQWGGADLGERYGGFFLACQKENNFDYVASRQCARDWCDRVFADKPDLLSGCSWFVEWFGLADNPTMHYKEVPCPQELSRVSGL